MTQTLIETFNLTQLLILFATTAMLIVFIIKSTRVKDFTSKIFSISFGDGTKKIR